MLLAVNHIIGQHLLILRPSMKFMGGSMEMGVWVWVMNESHTDIYIHTHTCPKL